MNGQSFADQPISLAPDELANAESDFVWNKGGTLQAEISPSDALDADNRAALTIPCSGPCEWRCLPRIRSLPRIW